MSKGLYDFLITTGNYSKSFQDFQSQFSNENSIQQLHEYMSGNGTYSKDLNEFKNQFFASKTKVPITPNPNISNQNVENKKEEEKLDVNEQLKTEARDLAIDKDFWATQKYKREDYYLKDGKWYYKSPKTEKEVLIARIKEDGKAANPGTVARLDALEQEEARYQNNLLKIPADKKVQQIKNEGGEEPNRNRYTFGNMKKVRGYTDDNGNFIELPGKPGGYGGSYTDPSTGKTYKVTLHPDANSQGFVDVGKVAYERDLKNWKETTGSQIEEVKRKSGAISEESVQINYKLQKNQTEYNKKISELQVKLNAAKTEEEKNKIREELKQVQAEFDKKLDGIDYEERNKKGKENMPTVTADLAGMDDDNAIDELVDKYGKYGFKFEISRTDGDKVTITAANGDVETFEFDSFFGDAFGGDTDKAKDLDGWMRPRAVEFSSVVDAFRYRMTLSNEEKEVKNEEARIEVNNYYETGNDRLYEDFIENYDSIPNDIEDSYEGRAARDIKQFAETYGMSEAEIRDLFYNQYGIKYNLETRSELDAIHGKDRKAAPEKINVPGRGYADKPRKGYNLDGIDDFKKKLDNRLSAKFKNVIKNEKIAIQNAAFEKFREEYPGLADRSNEELARMKGEKISEIIEEITEEWKDISNVSGYFSIPLLPGEEIDFDVEKFKNHPVYKQLKRIHGAEAIQNEVTRRVSEEIEGLGGEAFEKSEAQKTLRDKTNIRIDDLDERTRYVTNSVEVLSKELRNIDGDGSTYGLEYEAKWLRENEPLLKQKIEKIKSGVRTEEQRIAANKQIETLLNEFNSHAEKYNNLINSRKNIYNAAVSLQVEASEIKLEENDLKVIVDGLIRNHQPGTQAVNALANGTVDLIQGLLTAGEAVLYYANPFGHLGNYLIDSGVIENETLKTVVEVGQVLTASQGGRFDDDLTTQSFMGHMNERIDAWQQESKDLVQEPPRYDEIDSLSDFGEWAAVMLGSQAPQLALMYATAGQSALVQGLLMSSTAGGQKFMGMEEQKKLYQETSGIYGENFSFDQMFWSSAAVGLAESLSERVTFGQIKGVNRLLKQNTAASNGFKDYMRNVVFTKDYAKFVGRGVYDLVEEGGSEVIATMSENFVDILNGEDISIYDNIQESFVSGGLISGAIKSPILFGQMIAPFQSSNNLAIIEDADRRIKELEGLISMGRPTKGATQEEIEAWEIQEAKYTEQIVELGRKKIDALGRDIKRVNSMDDDAKRQVLDIDSKTRGLVKQRQEITNNPNLDQQTVNERVASIDNQIQEEINKRDEILGRYTPDIVDKRYKQDMDAAKKRAAERNALGGTQVTVTDGNDTDMFNLLANTEGYNVTRNEDGSIQNITLQPGARKGLINQMKEALESGNLNSEDTKMVQRDLNFLESGTTITMSPDDFFRLNGSKSNYGVQIPVFDNNGQLKEQKVFVNKARSLDAGKFYTASHELLHAILHQTLKRDPELQQAFGTMVLNALNNTGVKIPQALKDRIDQYSKEEGRGEEIMALLSEAVREGDVKLPGTAIRNMKNFFRTWTQQTTNRDISFDTDQDVINFIQDYSFSMKNNKENKAITRMWQKGAGGKLIADAQTEYRKRVEQNKVDPGEAMFSKNVEQAMSSQPDLMSEIDSFVKNPDGTPKYKTQNEFINSIDGGEAYNLITNTKKLDGLIQAGIMAQGINTPQAIGEFTRNVKDKLGERLLKNFDPAKNDSLFGWLTGVSGGAGQSIIYRAKGDVMVDYKKRVQTTSADVGVRTDTGETIGTQFEADVDTDVQAFENEIIIPGSNVRVDKNQTDVVFLESVNAKVTQSKVNSVIQKAGVNLKGLTYNGTKKMLVQHDGGKPKSKRKPTGPLYGALQSVSNLFGVDSMRVIKEQDLTGAQRTLAREYIKENAQQLIDMLPEGENRSGDATGVANTVLGEFYIKGERISMAESASAKGKNRQTKKENITTQEFVEFFNKPGTKSDGAIRALIVQSATIAANQSIRQNAIENTTETLSTIALVGDGKSATMFSKREGMPNYKKLGAFDARLNEQKRNIFWNRVEQLAGTVSANNAVPLKNKQGEIVNEDLSRRSIKEMVTDVYRDVFTRSEINELADSIYDVVSSKSLKYSVEIEGKIKNRTPKLNKDGSYSVEQQGAIVEALYTSKQDANTKISSFVGAGVTTASLGNDTDLMNVSRARIKTYIDTRVQEIKKEYAGQGDAVIGGQIIKMLSEQMDQHVTAGKVWDGRQQLFAATPDFVLNVASKIPGLNFAIKVAKDGKTEIDIKTATYDSNSNITRSSDNLLSTDTRSKRSEKLSQKDVSKRKSSVFTRLDPNLPGTTIQQQRFKNYPQSGPSLIADFIFDKNKVSERKQDALNAQLELNNFVRFVAKEYKEGRMSERELQVHMATLLSNMKPTLARAAMPKYIAKSLLPDGYQEMTKKEIQDYLKKTGAVYEHMQPRVGMIIHLFNQHINGNGVTDAQVPNFFSRYNIAIIPEAMDKKAINAVGLRESLAPGQTMTMPEWMRYYNVDTQQKMEHLDTLIDIDTGIELEPTAHISKTKEILNIQRGESNMFSKAVNNANAINENTPSRGASVFDFDETLIDKGENIIVATNPETGDKVEISSGQWPIQGPKYAEQGYSFDFSDFTFVKGGVDGPLLQKLRNRIKKFGPENNYVLTARPADAAPHIHEWLKSKGINIPLENITGLGNSTGEAKALWMAQKYSEGYNDMYFVDDAMPNVDAVKDIMDQLDIKGKSVQAKIQFSKRIKTEFSNIINKAGQQEIDLDLNRILEQTKGVKAESRFSDAQAKVRGNKKGKYAFFVPPSAEDFKGLIYRFLAKGKIGEQQMAFFKKALFDPFARATTSIDIQKQKIQNEYRQLLKQFPDVKADLNEVIYNNFTLGQMIRVYNWNKAGFEVPGLSQRDLDNIVKEIEADAEALAFADSLSIITNQNDGYIEPGEFWLVENIQSDLNKITNEINRDLHLQEFKQNREKIFGEWQGDRLVGPNMNKIEAIYGSNFREALEDILYRMEYGTKREKGSNRLVNRFNNWANQSVGAIMFFNMRSALLQTISSVNYLNWSDNNPLKAGLALANFPQFLKDFSMIFNSDMLKQRRAGNQRGINEAELAQAVGGVGMANRVKAMLNWLLTKGFLPTQIADSFAIASGGATFFRNRVNSYVKQGYTQTEAETKAFQDFQEVTEESQQSSRPDMISQQQASPLGRYILAFKNTPMQYARLMKRSYLDLVNGRGDYKTNVGKIIYYGGIQNLIFNGLQAALGALIGDDEEEDKKTSEHVRIANSMVDSILGGIGFGGNAVMTVKNAILEYNKQNNKNWNSDHTYTILKLVSFSPTVGSKLRKVYSSIQTEKFNKDVIGEMSMLDIDNPRWSAIANLISGATNIPLDRLVKKMDNIDAALTEDISNIERFALLMGWNTWDLDIEDQDIIAVENEIKERKQIEVKEKREKKKEENKRKKEEEDKVKEEENKKKNDGRCIAITSSGARCKNEAVANGYCTIHAKVEQSEKEVQCSKIKSNGERCKMKTKAKSGLCFYHD